MTPEERAKRIWADYCITANPALLRVSIAAAIREAVDEARASAFLEAAGRADAAAVAEKTRTCRRALERLANQFRALALEEQMGRGNGL